MDIIEFGALTPERKRELEGDERDPFDAAGISMRFRPKERHVALQDETGRLVASTGMVIADVEVAAQRFAVVGLGGVIVTARHRGKGLGRKVVQVALEKARTLGPAHALLFCHEDRAGLYRRLGFARVSAEVTVKQPDGWERMAQCTMWRGLREDADWPSGPVTLHSLPF